MGGKRDPGEIVSHLQIINTWASFAIERDINFFNEAHLKKMTEWTEDAIDLLKQNENDIHHMSLIIDEYERQQKEQEEQKRKMLQHIADVQLANAPIETMDATSHTYYDGVWHGLEMAYEILTEKEENE